MKGVILAAALALSGCVVVPASYPVYTVGYYDPALGYWDGYRWDFNFYGYGHRGYGHHYGYHHHR